MRNAREKATNLAAVRNARIRLLNVELDATRQSAIERTRSIDSKSSFAVVAAGVLAGTTLTGLVSAQTYFIGLLPFALTVGSVIAAIVALWPRRLWAPSGRQIVDEWVDKDEMTPEMLEDHLLEVKAREVEMRDGYNERRSKATKIGFVLLALSLTTSFFVVGLNTAVSEGVLDVGRNATTPTPSVTP